MQLDAEEKHVAYERAETALEEERVKVLDKEAKVEAFAQHVQKLWDDVEAKQVLKLSTDFYEFMNFIRFYIDFIYI